MKLKLSLAMMATLILSACQSNEPDNTSVAEPQVKVNEPEVESPNVVLILIDDLSHYGVTAYGADRLHSYDGEFSNHKFSTPNIDALARNGLKVDRAFAYPICENTRISLMSGKRNDRNYLQPKSQHESDITFGDVFKKAGYATGLFGKWKQTRGTNEVAGKDYIGQFGWDDYAAFDVVTEGQRFINPSLVINGEVVDYKNRTDVDPQTGRRWYGPDIVNRKALAFIEKNKAAPFFLYYPMILVHDDHKPTPATLPHSVFDNFPEKAQYNNRGGDDRQYFPDMIEYMDKLIGNVVKKLTDEGLLENTLIVVMGDNGTKETFGHVLPNGRIYPGRKGGNVDNGLHVPLVLHQPDVIPADQAGGFRSYDGLVNLTDIFPTIADAAGITIPNREQLDGISFWPQATGAQGEPRSHIYTWYIGNSTYTQDTELLRYAFNKNFKRYAPDAFFPDGRFFDLRTDPLEREGDRVQKRKWGLLRYSGLDTASLTSEQQKGYDELGQVLAENVIQPVEALAINAPKTELTIGETIQLTALITPRNASRQGVIWESSNPAVATINKFGELTTHAAGQANIRVYSWDDAYPVSANRKQSYYRDGITRSKTITVE